MFDDLSAKQKQENIFYLVAENDSTKIINMKKYFLLIIFTIGITTLSGQVKNNASVPQAAKSEVKDSDLEIYNLAIQYGDYDVAKHALYSLLAKHPESIGYLDSLVMIYYNMNAFQQCIFAGNAYLEKDSDNLDVMEMVALSNSSLKRNKEAVALYEKMFLKTGKIYFAYQLAIQQYLLKRIGECNQMIDIISNDPQSTKESIAIATDNGTQNVPLKAAAFNLRGIIFKEINMKDKAKENFESALKVFPDFAMAKKNLDAITDKKETPAKSESKELPKK